MTKEDKVPATAEELTTEYLRDLAERRPPGQVNDVILLAADKIDKLERTVSWLKREREDRIRDDARKDWPED